MRDDKWLFERLDEVWDKYFSDMPQENNVKIVWGRRAKNQLGCIKRGEKSSRLRSNNKIHQDTIITINSLFKDEKIPEFVVIATIAHELAHYAHGFHSPLERKYSKPHEGGVVHKELDERGLGQMLKKQKKWLKENWSEYIKENLPNSMKPRKVKRRVIIKWI